MKRLITIALVIIVSFVLQSTVFQVIALANVVPNLLLIVTVAFGYMRGRTEGLITGLFCGLVLDMVYGDIIGVCALIYMIIGYLNGFWKKVYYRDEITIPLILISVSDFLCNFLYYIANFLIHNHTNLFFYVRRIMLPELVYTVVIAILLYKVLHIMNQWLEYSEEEEV